MLIRKAADIRSSEITPEETFQKHSRDRRRFLATAATLGAGALAGSRLGGLIDLVDPRTTVFADTQSLQTVSSQYTVPDAQTPEVKATHYNNFYEFGTDKTEPANNAHTLQTRPWTVTVDGMVAKPLTLDVDSIAHYRPLESRVYRHRCVEAWSMVVPWDGYSLAEFIKFCQPTSGARYVQFISNINKKQMPDLPGGFDWPYSEGLRLDEAMNPLALLCFGCYGKVLPNQNGAPIRVVMPWKYGFKNAKSIVKFHFTDKQPKTLWNEMASNEYGFYANVNPTVDHPRWTQAHERRIDSSAFPRTVPTLPFNGYADQVGGMYAGMDLRKFF